MKLGIMQPYFVPYIGYWQLLNAVDKYVIYDDVNYIKGGWINRNRILIDGEPKYFNIQMKGASPNKKINEIYVDLNAAFIAKNLRTVRAVYQHAPYFNDTYALLEKIFSYQTDNLALFLINSIRSVCESLGITTELLVSSSIDKDCTLKGQTKVLSICRLLKATEYYNAIGGMELYSFDDFSKNGIQLKFLKTDEIVYNQFGNQFVSGLSIIDVMMFNSKDEIKQLLNRYSIITDNIENLKIK